MDKTLFAGVLQHRIAIQEPLEDQDSDTGEITIVWATVSGLENIGAQVADISVKEFISAQAMQSQVTTRIVVRYSSATSQITAKMRAVHNGTIYNIHGAQRDPRTGLEWLTLPCSKGVNEG